MNLRTVSVVALFIALVAVAAWWWRGRVGMHPATPAGHESSTKEATPGSSPTGHGHGPAAPARDGVSPAPVNSPAAAARLTSSVVPGMPLVRTESPPPGPAAAAAPVASAPLPRPEKEPEGRADLESVRFMLRDFRTRLGENPVGSNAEIMRAVMGGNAAGARLGPPAGQSVNEDGNLIDRWGTPYFFHQVSKISMEIRSAGPDRRMWTADDLVTK